MISPTSRASRLVRKAFRMKVYRRWSSSISMNVDDYLARINYKGSLEPTLSTLTDLTWCHKLAIPYTNIEFIAKGDWKSDLKGFYKTAILDKEGGTCVEINYLFSWLLTQLGYKTKFFSSHFYIEKTKEWSEFYSHCFLVVDFDEKGCFFVDPGFQLNTPMKFEPMTPHVEQHGVYRFREVPEEKNWFYLERHKKTILNKRGEVLKQGPGVWNGATESSDGELCLSTETRHWKWTHLFRAVPVEIEEFNMDKEKRKNSIKVMTQNLILLRYYNGGYNSIFGNTYYVKKCPNPLTDVIMEEKEVKTDEEIREMARGVFGYEIKQSFRYFTKAE